MFSPERFLLLFLFLVWVWLVRLERDCGCACVGEREGESFVFFGFISSSYFGWRMRTVTLEFDAMHFWHSSSVTQERGDLR